MEIDPTYPENSAALDNDAAAAEVRDLMKRIISIREASISPADLPLSPAQTRARTKNILGGVVGNALEWYDFAIFGFLAPIIGDKFFPSDDPLDSLLSTFSVFAAAYLVRPIGGMIFGYIGDHYGRMKALQLSVMMMAIPTFLIGVLPTHDQIGWLAPFLLVVLRVAQGLSVGGELIGSIAFVAETAPTKERGFFSSWTFASCYGGMMLGALTAVGLGAYMGDAAMEDWGWRLPFLSGIFIGLLGIWMARALEETPTFEKMKAEGKIGGNPLREALQEVPGRIFHAAMLVILVGGGFYILFVWWPTMLSRFIHPHVPHALALNTFALILLVILIPFTGRLCDKIGRKPILVWSCAALTLLTWPLFMLASQGTFFAALVSQLCFTVIMAFYLGPVPAALVEMFPPRVRYSAIGLGYNLSLCIFGGTAPFFATWLVKNYHSIAAPALYLVVLSALNLVAALNLPDKKFAGINASSFSP